MPRGVEPVAEPDERKSPRKSELDRGLPAIEKNMNLPDWAKSEKIQLSIGVAALIALVMVAIGAPWWLVLAPVLVPLVVLAVMWGLTVFLLSDKDLK